MMSFIPSNYQISPNQHYFKAPITIDDFLILTTLGQGHHGRVLKVKYKITGKIYALKTQDQEKFINKDTDIDYLREKSILYELTKKNYKYAVKLYADFEDNKSRYLVTEYCEGKSLDKLRGDTGGYVGQQLVIHILTQLLETLKYLHDTCHIIHRDIKPDNIILDKENNIKVLDFGLSVYLSYPDKRLVSNKSLKAFRRFAPPEILFFHPPLNYDYKIDIFALGFTIYSLMNPSKNDKLNLPQETEGTRENIRRYDNDIVNTFYDVWLIEFVQLLYENDQTKRPSASNALGLLKGFQTNPSIIKTYNDLKQLKDRTPIKMLFKRRNVQQSNIALINIDNNLPINYPVGQKMKKVEEYLRPNMGKENIILSSMKCILFILSKLDNMNFIKAQFHSIFTNSKSYQNSLMYSFYQIIDTILKLHNNQINKKSYEQIVSNFIKNIFINNNSGISGTRPIILFYMMSSIFKNEIQKNFKNIESNNIFDNIIQNNFFDYNCILPMDIPKIYNSMKEKILSFKNNYKGPFVENFYFLLLNLSKCPVCGNLFGISNSEVTQFLQLDVPKLENNLQDLINDYFTPKIGYGDHYDCKSCGSKGKKYRHMYCLNLPNYLFLELEDKNKINFSDRIFVPLYNGQNYCYQYYATIYKIKIDNVSNFCVVLKIGNIFYLYSNDVIQQVNQKYTFLDCPSLALYKKI